MAYLLLTDPGLEDLVRDEIQELEPSARIDERPARGAVRVTGVDLETLLGLTTVDRVVEIRHEEVVHSLEDVRQASAASDWPELAVADSFRVTAIRRGEHSFTRVELAAACGGVLHGRYKTAVDLDHYQIDLRAELIDDRLVLGLGCHRGTLGNRTLRPRALRTALKPIVAAAMIRLCGAHRGPGRLIDPMCGSGTVPIEALRINPALRVEAADWDAPTVDVAGETLEANGVTVRVSVADVRSLGADSPGAYDAIVSDPPYGLRQATRIPLSTFYRPMLLSLEAALAPEGSIALIVLKPRTFERSLAATRLQAVRRLGVDLGRIQATIFLLRHDSRRAG